MVMRMRSLSQRMPSWSKSAKRLSRSDGRFSTSTERMNSSSMDLNDPSLQLEEKSFQLVAGGTSDQLRWLEIDNGVKKDDDDAPISELSPSEDPSGEEPSSEDALDDIAEGENADGENADGEIVVSENATSVHVPSVKAASVKATSVKAVSVKTASEKIALDDATDVDPDEAINYVLQCNDDVNHHLRQINDALNLISIMGPTRSGKSTLMNLLAGCTEEPLFSTSPGAESWTRGTNLGNKIMGAKEFSRLDDGVEVALANPQKVAFLDTEGHGDQGDLYDIMLFTPAILCSRVIVFNTTDVAKDTILTSLAMMTLAANKLNFGGDKKTSGPKFGQLVIIINKYDLGGSVDDVRKNILKKEIGRTEAVKRRNKIREKLASEFEGVTVHLLRGNSLKEGVQSQINDKTKEFLVLDDFNDNYVKDFKNLRAQLSQMLRTPRLVAGAPLSGASTADFVSSIVKSINRLEQNGQLHVPDIWRAAENEAINRSHIKLHHDFREACNKLIQDPALISTKDCNKKLDRIMHKCMADVRNSLKYLSQQTIKDTCESLIKESDGQRNEVLAANLQKIEAFAEKELADLIASIQDTVNDAVSDFKSISSNTAEKMLDQLHGDLLEAYKKKISSYDEQALRGNYAVTYDRAFFTAAAIAKQNLNTAWASWLVEQDTTSSEAIAAAFEKLYQETLIGDESIWETSADEEQSSHLTHYNNTIDTEYLWENAETIKTNYSEKVDKAKNLVKAKVTVREQEMAKDVAQELEKHLAAYQRQLDESLLPKDDVGEFKALTDTTTTREKLITFLKEKSMSNRLYDHYLNEFDNQLSAKKSTFGDKYSAVLKEFLSYIDKELDRVVKAQIDDFKNQSDTLQVTRFLSKEKITSHLATCESTAKAAFESNVAHLSLSQEEAKLRVTEARNRLASGISDYHIAKLLLLDSLVNKWNRQALNRCVNEVLSGVVDFTLDTPEKLEEAVRKAKMTYFGEACGEMTKQAETWETFERKADTLYENIRRAQAVFKLKGISYESTTSELESKVIHGISRPFADLANLLGMSWISSGSEFQHELHPEGNSRSYLLKNLSKPKGYGNKQCTSLRFDNWTAEFSDFVFDEPIIQELSPFTVKTLTVPAQDENTQVNIAIKEEKTEAITHSNAAMFTAQNEYASATGIEQVVTDHIKAAFNGSDTFVDAKRNEVTLNIDFDCPVICPANRATTVTCSGYTQLMSITYTAKMKLVPEVTFTGGYVRTGSKTGEAPNFLKGETKKRVYTDIPNGPANELKDKAASDADPWNWTEALAKNPNIQPLVDRISDPQCYEMYVRGKWEGISGWKFVIQTDIKTA
ncbi:hypothetical protein TsFJ059_008926 [Trichoderma semiorbis]|uniref:Guanylate-binding protein N-terminal domain-containing protein n=1 Tax=Trichoderma semiorbis TaxID=1491008 RepID=A0A9P8KRL1_9HYPO|nr:hypothetical protein TsFJ059_008926 [Trichoderma semiorbis]